MVLGTLLDVLGRSGVVACRLVRFLISVSALYSNPCPLVLRQCFLGALLQIFLALIDAVIIQLIHLVIVLGRTALLLDKLLIRHPKLLIRRSTQFV